LRQAFAELNVLFVCDLDEEILQRSDPASQFPKLPSLLGGEGERVLRRYLSRDLIIVGHGPRDYDINRAIEREGGSIWYISQSPPSMDDLVYQAMRARGTQTNVISGEFGLFDRFFEALHSELMHF